MPFLTFLTEPSCNSTSSVSTLPPPIYGINKEKIVAMRKCVENRAFVLTLNISCIFSQLISL